jgi:hypothetical protein
MTSSKLSFLTDLKKSTDTSRPRTDTMANVPLLRKVIEHITEHPSEWGQGNWGLKTACGTSHCFAGHAAILSGYEPVWVHTWDGENAPQVMLAVSRHGYTEDNPFHAAADLLELTPEEALDLFSCDNTMRDLWYYVNLFSDGEIEIPPAYR